MRGVVHDVSTVCTQLLQRLRYIDTHKAVQLKGRVACEISNHELMITELVFENVLTDLHPTDIAALLSSMVFEQRNCSAPELTDTLKQVCVGQLCGSVYAKISFLELLNISITQLIFFVRPST